MVKIGPRALALIKVSEGCRLQAYPDPGSGADPWTIGYGATGHGIKRGTTWTQEQCDQRLVEDLARFEDGVAEMTFGHPTSGAQFGALVAFAFNVGLGNLRSSSLLKLHNLGKFALAAAEFPRWNRAAGRILPGLTKRRRAEAALYLEG